MNTIIPTTTCFLQNNNTKKSKDSFLSIGCISGYCCFRRIRSIWIGLHWLILSFTTSIRTLPRIFCISRWFRRLIRNVFQYGLLFCLFFILVIWLGAEYEGYHIRNSPDTVNYYNAMSDVCAFQYPQLLLLQQQQQQQQASTRTDNSTSTTMNGTNSSSVSVSSSNSNSKRGGGGFDNDDDDDDDYENENDDGHNITNTNATTERTTKSSDHSSTINEFNETTITILTNFQQDELLLPPLIFETFSSVEEARNTFNSNNNNTGSDFNSSDYSEEYDISSTNGTTTSANNEISASTSTSTSSSISTSTTEDIDDATVIIAHCGKCGACSTPRDIHIYDETKNTLLQYSTQCAKRGLIWGRRTATNCMKDAVGFTDECNTCWIENIMCDLKLCIFTCMWFGLFVATVDDSSSSGSGSGSGSSGGGGGGGLNPCTLCDEKRCGPQFVTCAGANRRRSGIVSDIVRDTTNEVCHKVDDSWWMDYKLRTYYEETIIQQEQHEQQNEQNEQPNEEPNEDSSTTSSTGSSIPSLQQQEKDQQEQEQKQKQQTR